MKPLKLILIGLFLNPFDESSEAKSIERGTSKTHIDKIKILIEKTSDIDLNAPSLENT